MEPGTEQQSSRIPSVAADGTAPFGAPEPHYRLVTYRTPHGLSVHLSAEGWQRVYLLSPMRQPGSPRHWGIRVEICTTTGDPDPTLPALEVDCALNHPDMISAFKLLRADPVAWLMETSQVAVRTWMMEHDRPVEAAGEAPAAAPTTNDDEE